MHNHKPFSTQKEEKTTTYVNNKESYINEITRQLRLAHLYLLFRGDHPQGYTKFVLLVHGWKINVENINAS